MSTRIATEDVASTKSEKFLAVLLAAFVLMGSGWFYWKTYEWVGPDGSWEYTAAEDAVIDRANEADENLWNAEERLEAARFDVDQARADLSLAVSKGDKTAALEELLESARAEQENALLDLAEAKKTAQTTNEEREAVENAVSARAHAADTGPRRWAVAGIQLGMVIAMLWGSITWMRRLRERESRWVPIAFSVAAAGTIMAFVFVVDYVTDWIDFLELGPIVLSLIGIGITVSAFIGLQKYLVRRIPRARVRKGECPFCAFPVKEDNAHCEGCGREVVAACVHCGQDRRVGSPHCGHCGKG